MAASPASDALVAELLQRFGRTYAQEAGIRLADQPAPLYQLLVLATLISARISADIAVAAARELFAAGYRTPRAMTEASWQDRVDALGRGHYKRYDERTATMLGDGAELLTKRWHGDLRRLRDEASGGSGRGGGDTKQIAALLQEFPGIGPAGASIFLREVQAVWPSVAPYLDDRVLAGARELGLASGQAALAKLAGSDRDLARLAAALVRVTLTKNAADQVRQAAQDRG
jgi:endonuclease III